MIHYILIILLIFTPFHLKANNDLVNNLITDENFEITVFADGINTPRQMSEGNKGYIFVGTKSGQVHAIRDTDKNGIIDQNILIADNLNDPAGVAFHDGNLYIAEVGKIWKVEDIETILDKNQVEEFKLQLITDELPNESWHGRKWIKFDKDGSFLVNVGAPCNVCLKDDKRFASIMRFENGSWQIEANGVRNSVGFDWHPTNGKLYFTDNGRDWLGDDSPDCELNVLDFKGEFFGFPFRHAMNVDDPEFGDYEHGFAYKDPILELGAHVAPTGIEFYESNHFPKEYRNNAFITLHGSWNRSSKVGYKVIRVMFDNDGNVVDSKDFLTGFLEGETVLGRPAAPFEMSDGTLLISDDKANMIYRVTYKKS